MCITWSGPAALLIFCCLKMQSVMEVDDGGAGEVCGVQVSFFKSAVGYVGYSFIVLYWVGWSHVVANWLEIFPHWQNRFCSFPTKILFVSLLCQPVTGMFIQCSISAPKGVVLSCSNHHLPSIMMTAKYVKLISGNYKNTPYQCNFFQINLSFLSNYSGPKKVIWKMRNKSWC